MREAFKKVTATGVDGLSLCAHSQITLLLRSCLHPFALLLHFPGTLLQSHMQGQLQARDPRLLHEDAGL